MRVPGRWVLSIGMALSVSGCLPAASQALSLGPPAPAEFATGAVERAGSRPIDSAPNQEQQKSGNSRKWILIGAAAAALVVGIILIAGGGSAYHSPEGQVARIP